MRAVLGWFGAHAVAIIAAIVLLSVGIALYQWQHDRTAASEVLFNQHVAKLDSAITKLATAKYKADTVYVATVEHFHTTHDSVIHDFAQVKGDSVSKTTATAAVERITNSCSLVISACQARADIAQALADSLRSENELFRHARAPSLPRLSLYGDALYDPVGATPVLRAGVSARVIGPLSAVAEIEGARIPGDSNYNIRGRALIGGRYTFR